MPEFEARTVKEAIDKGLEALGLAPDDAIIDVLDEGQSGVFGMGGRPARVRITPKGESGQIAPATDEEPPADQETFEEAAETSPESDIVASEATVDEKNSGETEEDLVILGIVTEFLQGLLDRMGLKAAVEASVLHDGDEPTYRLNITGDDLGILIGRRAETLDSIQYLARLVVNQRTHRWHRIEVDVENYKQRREQSLQRLARNMADRAVSEGHTIVLEPMPPRERRLIHLALRDRDDVRTESIGEGDDRKVTIIPM